MSITTTAHLNFRGNARDALSYYQSVFDGDLMLATYADIHSAETAESADHIAFGRLRGANGFDLMAYDVQPSKGYQPGENAFYITLQGTDPDEITALWNKLADDAHTIHIPLAPAPFAPLYGMLTDRFDTTWIIGIDTCDQRWCQAADREQARPRSRSAELPAASTDAVTRAHGTRHDRRSTTPRPIHQLCGDDPRR